MGLQLPGLMLWLISEVSYVGLSVPYFFTGRITEKVVPHPILEVRSNVPMCELTIRFTIASPIPEPPFLKLTKYDCLALVHIFQ